MMAARVMEETRRFAANELGLQVDVVGVVPHIEGWRVTAEAVVDSEYMRERAQRDLVAVYEFQLDQQPVVTSFERKAIRERGTPTGGH